eukprot:TRINITY_DN4579_c0_g1_i1.p1 TRINITY_DN4579_c0_g1~~TRINITY_DN4579_c0_g1_i1.p1  ORF type:complete len:370 (+),score=97.03 TRINITY_DN4579_c0_g1_i1:274-1383(+)
MDATAFVPALQGVIPQHASIAAPAVASAPPQLSAASPGATYSKAALQTGALASAIGVAAIAARGHKEERRRGARKERKVQVLRSAANVDTSGAMHFVTIKDGSAEATIYLRGAALSSFKTNGTEWLGMRADAAFDGSKANISGGVPICFPQFGPGDPMGCDLPNPETAHIPCHGLVRNMDWKVIDDASSGSKVVMECVDTEETRKVWPHAFLCRCEVEVKDNKLSWALTINNTSDSDCKFTTGIHTYYHTSDVDTFAIEGPFKGCTKMNRKLNPPVPETCADDVVKITGFCDDIYKNIFPGKITLKDSAKADLEIVHGGGFKSSVIWNPYDDTKMGYKNFVCVEGVATDAITLAPAASWSGTLELIPKV